ncbi:DNA-binding protein WhiA [Eubacteriales bacterium OttesenSCG-928-K08]|nr:DNA-binding protein WhiA [Eubacteriales bacterium OttesenSCG-928-K08]
MPSFSAQVRQELTKVRLRSPAAKRAQLAGMTHAAGVLTLGRSAGVQYVSETPEVATQIEKLASALYDVAIVQSLRVAEHRKRPLYVVAISGVGCEALLADAGVLVQTDLGVELSQIPSEALFETPEARRAFLRGAFLGAGSVSDPGRTYHLEIVCQDVHLANTLMTLLSEFDCPAKTVCRKQKYVVYLKDGDRISSFLALLGASTSTLRFEQTRTEKDLRNYINRTSNCETANIGKTVNAAGDQVDAIKKILADPFAVKRLSPLLRETAELRLNNPQMNLLELAQLANVGKSGMNHRLQRLLQIARELP